MSETSEEDIKAMFADLKIRDQARLYLLDQRITDHAFHHAISRYIAEIPLDRQPLESCFACASALCDICGGCHELDRRFLFVPPKCQPAKQTRCIAWSWAYWFLKSAKEVVAKEGQSCKTA